MLLDRCATAFALVAITLSRAAGAQTRIIPPSVEVSVSERWLYGGQRSPFVPFKQHTFWMFVQTAQPRVDVTGTRAHVVNFDTPYVPYQTTTIEAPPDGHFPQVITRTDTSTLRYEVVFSGQLSLPASRLWELVPSFHPSRLVSGEQWTDTLSFAAEQSGFRQALSGVRLSTLLGDTTFEGRRLWIVRDSAAVTYEENATGPGRTLEHTVVERRATGVMIGRTLVDPATNLLRARLDTAILAGKAVLRSSDGRTTETPARFERRRRWIAYDSAASPWMVYIRSYQESNTEHPPATLPAILVASPFEIQRRFVAGDSSYRDSLIAVLRRTQDPNERAFLISGTWWNRGPSLQRQINEIRLASGDSAYRLEVLTNRLGRAGWFASSTIDEATMRRGIALMDNPGALLLLQYEDDVFRQLAGALVGHPPAIYADTNLWPCRPRACRLLASQWRTARDPRLRDLGLIAHFVLQPKPWIDSILADTSEVVERARLLARGVGAFDPLSSQEPIPPASATWQAWVEWMVGQSRTYVDPEFGNRYAFRMQHRKLRFEQSHAAALRFTALLTGRNIVGELRDMLAQATSDSAKFVLEFMLYKLGEHHPTVASVDEHLRSGSRLRLELGIHELPSLFNGSPPLADTATTTLLTGRLIEKVFANEQPWPMLDTTAIPFQLPVAMVSGSVYGPMVFLADSVPSSLGARWSGRLVGGAAAARIRNGRDLGTLVTVRRITRVGPFAHFDIDVDHCEALRMDSTDYPQRSHASWRFFVMQLSGEWVIVSATRLNELPN